MEGPTGLVGKHSPVPHLGADQFGDITSAVLTFDDRVPVKEIEATRSLTSRSIVLMADKLKDAVAVLSLKVLPIQDNVDMKLPDSRILGFLSEALRECFAQREGKRAAAWIANASAVSSR